MNWDDGRRSGAAPPERPLGDVLEAYLRAQGHGEVALLGRVCQIWDATVGAEVAAHASPRALDGEALVVSVDHPAWVTQLAFLGRDILAALAERLGEPVAERLKVTVRSGAGVE